MKSGEKRETIPIPGDFSTWAGGEKKSLEIRIEPKIAELFLELRRKKTEKSSGLQMKKAQTACFSAACASVKNNVQESVKVPTGMVSLVS